MFSEKRLWTSENVGYLVRYFAENLKEGEGKFLEKLETQLLRAPGTAKQLAAEMFWVMFLAVTPAWMKPDTKRRQIRQVWEWSGAAMPDSPQEFEKALNEGVAYPGIAFNTYRWLEFQYFIRAIEDWKSLLESEQRSLLADPWRFAKWLLSLDSTGNRQLRHILTYLLFPDHFEPVSTNYQKKDIVRAFREKFGQDPNEIDYSDAVLVDRQVLKIRKRLESEGAPKGLSFYDQGVREVWEHGKKTPGKSEKKIPPAVDAAFSERAFELLGAIHEQPTRAFYKEHENDLRTHVEQPVKHLLTGVAAELELPLTEVLETQKRLFSRFPKNDYGKGGAWDFYWGAFYPRGDRRPASAQLFVWINRDQLEYGFSINQVDSERWTRFVDNVRKHQTGLEAALTLHLNQGRFQFGAAQANGDAPDPTDASSSLRVWLQNIDNQPVSVKVIVPREELLSVPATELRQDIQETFQQLFPLVLLATSDDPLSLMSEYWDMEEGEEETQEEYPLEQCAEETGFPVVTLQQWADAVDRKGQAVFYGPPGTGKTYMAERIARHLVGGGDGFAEIVQFHPAYAYEDFIQGIRPRTRPDGRLEYRLIPGRFLEFCREARRRSGVCVLIVDEFNRANLSRVFGELMYLLEYRDAEIPLSGGGPFSIPRNVRIIGTMNTADRSIALVDHALRRRFAFVALHPSFEILQFYHKETGASAESLVMSLVTKLKQINLRIGDPNYHLGITFFMRSELELHLEAIWRMEIEPYLEEYFFDDAATVDEFRWDAIREELDL